MVPVNKNIEKFFLSRLECTRNCKCSGFIYGCLLLNDVFQDVYGMV